MANFRTVQTKPYRQSAEERSLSEELRAARKDREERKYRRSFPDDRSNGRRERVKIDPKDQKMLFKKEVYKAKAAFSSAREDDGADAVASMAAAFIRLSGLLSKKGDQTGSTESLFARCKEDLLTRAAEKPVHAEGVCSFVEILGQNPGWVQKNNQNARLVGQVLTRQIKGLETNFFATPKSTGYLLADSLRIMGAKGQGGAAGQGFVDLLDGKLDFENVNLVFQGFRAFSRARARDKNDRGKYVSLVLDGFWALRKGASDAKLGEDLCERKLESLVSVLRFVYPQETRAALRAVRQDEAFYGSLSPREAKTVEAYLDRPKEAAGRPLYDSSCFSTRQRGPGAAL